MDSVQHQTDYPALASTVASPRIASRRLFADLCVPTALGPGSRERFLRRMADQVFDLLIVGAGVVGCGAALDAASRGLSVALVEQTDLASGSLGPSCQVGPGALGYLEQFVLSTSRQVLREQELLMRHLAPHLVKPMSLMVPLRLAGSRRPGTGRQGGQVLGITRAAARRQRVSAAEAARLAPCLPSANLRAGLHYIAGQLDDTRLAIALARTAAEQGAAVTTATPLVALLQNNNRIAGAVIVDEETDELIHVRSKAVLACTGVATDQLYHLTGQSGPLPLPITAQRMVHLVLDRYAVDSQVGLITPTAQGVLYLIPWRGYWLVGTDRPCAPGEDVSLADLQHLLELTNSVLERPIRPDQVVGAFTGLRPWVEPHHLPPSSRAYPSRVGSPGVSRDFLVEELAPGLTGLAGGRWTSYRWMAEVGVTEAMRPVLGQHLPPSRTATMVLSGSRAFATSLRDAPSMAGELGLGVEVGERLALHYGAHAFELLDLVRQQPELALPVADTETTIAAEVVYACRFDGALHVADVIDRRLKLCLTGPASEATQLDVAAHMSRALGWDNTRTDQEMALYAESVQAHEQTLSALRPTPTAVPQPCLATLS